MSVLFFSVLSVGTVSGTDSGLFGGAEKEIRFCAGLQRGKRLTSVYIGGGTPTTLSAGQMEELLQCLYESFPVNEAAEITVEAGRPDSITRKS